LISLARPTGIDPGRVVNSSTYYGEILQLRSHVNQSSSNTLDQDDGSREGLLLRIFGN
jgi:hypothetical protein